MSMMPPPFSSDPSDDGIPAADPGAGAPPPSPGFGIGGEEPDVVPDGEQTGQDAQKNDLPAGDTPFRTPDPRAIGPEAPVQGPAAS